MRLLAGTGHGAWNFGPEPDSFRTVAEAADLAVGEWGSGASWTTDDRDHPHEAELLTLDASRARTELGWHDHLDFGGAVVWTVDWSKRVAAGESPRDVTLAQIDAFEALRAAGQ